jgi:uncharacterized membrane protein YhhN
MNLKVSLGEFIGWTALFAIVVTKFNLLLGGSVGWTAIFLVLAFLAVATQLTKEMTKNPLPGIVRHLLKAAPAIFLAIVCWYLHAPILPIVALLLCATGDILLDISEDKTFVAGAVAFAAALICLAIYYFGRQTHGVPLLPLAGTNVVIAFFILRWVIPLIPKSRRVLEIPYFGLLILSNILSATCSVPIFLGSSLWFMSDLSIGLSSRVKGSPTNSLDTLGLYDFGLYFLTIGFLTS